MTGLVDGIALSAANLGEMMTRCVADREALAQDRLGLTMASIVRHCLACRDKAVCRQWLDAVPAAGIRAAPKFCPNGGRFRLAG